VFLPFGMWFGFIREKSRYVPKSHKNRCTTIDKKPVHFPDQYPWADPWHGRYIRDYDVCIA
jgi:hypothetical protein